MLTAPSDTGQNLCKSLLTCFYNESTGQRPFFITNAMSEQSNISHLSPYQQQQQREILSAARPRPRPQFQAHSPSGSSGYGNADSAPRKKFVAKGHDSQLQEAQHNKFPVEVNMLDGGVVRGTVSRRDKYTITVNMTAGGPNQGKDLMIFKHAIESVLIDRVQLQPSAE